MLADKKIHVATFGCQMNVDDSERMAWLMAGQGYTPTAAEDEADLIVVNTCSVRAKAEHKAYSLLGRLRRLKEINPELVIVLAGCLAQQEKDELLARFDHLDAVLGPGALNRLPAVVAQAAERRRAVETALDGEPPRTMTGEIPSVGVKSQVTIITGCDNFCAYCVVPLLRGRERSRPPEEVLAEVEAKVEAGAREINLLGQNVNSYRYQDWDFVRLLRAVAGVEGLWRVRFTTSHPKDMSPELIACFGELPNLCPFLHLPFQSGSDRILKAMNRKYTRADYLALVDELRRVRPDIALSADVIVGFPGETEEDYAATLELIERVGFDSLFSFRYSDRPGTAASRLPDKVDERVSARRLTELQALQKEITLAANRALEGRVVEVLVEGPAKRGGLLTGRTPTNKVVNFRGDEDLIGRLVEVVVEAGWTNSLQGRIKGR